MPLSRFELARYLRRTMSGIEWNLWSCVRANQLDGFKFRRKALVGPYIVDFACLSARLVVEVGGETYDGRRVGDDGRESWLRSRGFRYLQFTNAEVAERLDHVLGTIRMELHTPLPFGERGISRAGPGRESFRGRRARGRRPVARAP